MGQLLRREKVAEFVANLHKSGKTVVCTNGCFDILHVGHVRYLEKTKSFADYMIVLLNSDKSVRSIKGEGRPINCEDDRAEILCALKCVDFVVLLTKTARAICLMRLSRMFTQKALTTQWKLCPKLILCVK